MAKRRDRTGMLAEALLFVVQPRLAGLSSLNFVAREGVSGWYSGVQSDRHLR
jgi:hypothetical protein